MNSLEIIHLRASIEPVEPLGDRIKTSIVAEGGDSEVVTIYRRHGLETDVAIHIRRRETPDTAGPSVLGLRLASALKALGLVEHSLWKELP